ncbi:peptidoglycan-binding protein [Streptomyces sp. NPDC059175]|uniref:peptidoglycan-binding protein n=1 Tax=Streptomyces sp. NPDC059175 TaxID=3346757 RepID=UPI003688168C
MSVPVFEEYEPGDCACSGCVRQGRARARGLPLREGSRPAARGAHRALVLITAAGMLGSGCAGVLAPSAAADSATAGPEARASVGARVAADRPGDPEDPETDTPQGGQGPLHGLPAPGQTGGQAVLPKTTRTAIINRAKSWVAAKVPYSMTEYWSDGYRQDCSGYVSMAWGLASNEWTGSLANFGVRIDRKDLQPGDILLFHNLTDPAKGSHVTIFGGWTDYTHTYYVAYEQTKPSTRKRATPMAYWTNSSSYVAYRYKGLVGGTTTGLPAATTTTATVAATATATAAGAFYPGRSAFLPGAVNRYVAQLGRLLVERGAKSFYGQGPDPRWGEADRRATAEFQRAQGWTGAEADGTPGPDTWRRLVNGTGKDIPRAGAVRAARTPPAYPGGGSFGPGRSNPHIETLGRQLAARGFGRHSAAGPRPLWSEAVRRNVEEFQRAQGWRGGAADGIPGPETWRRLFP